MCAWSSRRGCVEHVRLVNSQYKICVALNRGVTAGLCTRCLVKIVLGTASIGSNRSPLAKINTPEDVDPVLDLFRSRGYFEIDTARAYPIGAAGTYERLLGQRSLSKWAEVSTKVSSFMPGCHSAKSIMRSINYSLEPLNVESVDMSKNSTCCFFSYHEGIAASLST